MKTIHNITFFILLLVAPQVVNCQTNWQKVYGGHGYDYGYSVIQTYDGGYAIAGATTTIGNGNSDAYLLKVDSVGNIELQNSFGGINIDQAYSIKETRDSGLVFAGFTNSFGNGGYDMYVVRTDKLGDTLWTKTYGGADWDFAYSIDTTTDGGFIIAGETYSYGAGNKDMYIVKIDANGDSLWTKTYGGPNEDGAKSIKQTNDNGYIVTGFSKSLGDPNGDIYTLKLDNNGDTLWTYKYDGLLGDVAHDIIENNNASGYILVGETRVADKGLNGISINIDTLGNQTKLDYWGYFDGDWDDGLYSIARSVNGRPAVAGYTYSFDNQANYLYYLLNPGMWFNCGWPFGLYDFDKAYSINSTRDGGFIICGNSLSYSNLDHILLVKIDNDTTCVVPGDVTNIITDVNTIVTTKDKMQLFPNPASRTIYINFSDGLSQKATVSITDLMGRIIHTSAINSLNSTPLEIKTNLLAEGIYFVRLKSDEFSISKKLVIRH